MPGLPLYEPRWVETPWMVHAACRGCDPKLWFPERGGDYASAKAVCATCPVVDECLDHAIETREVHGVWGGRSERERRVLRRERGLTRDRVECGTYPGYDRHRRRCEEPCGPCRAANADYKRQLRTAS